MVMGYLHGPQERLQSGRVRIAFRQPLEMGRHDIRRFEHRFRTRAQARRPKPGIRVEVWPGRTHDRLAGERRLAGPFLSGFFSGMYAPIRRSIFSSSRTFRALRRSFAAALLTELRTGERLPARGSDSCSRLNLEASRTASMPAAPAASDVGRRDLAVQEGNSFLGAHALEKAGKVPGGRPGPVGLGEPLALPGRIRGRAFRGRCAGGQPGAGKGPCFHRVAVNPAAAEKSATPTTQRLTLRQQRPIIRSRDCRILA